MTRRLNPIVVPNAMTVPIPMHAPIRKIAALLIAGLAVALAPELGRSQPNVVLIITDDIGYGDIGVFGATDLQTPNIDSLARDGVLLTDFYANGPTCSPTRAGLISGRYQQRFGVEWPIGFMAEEDHDHGLPVTGHSLPALLSANGYRTGLVGKWHLGWRDEFRPRAHGFDYFFGFKSGYVDYYQHTPGSTSPLEHDLWENEEEIHVDGYMTDLISEQSVAFIERNANGPFFLDVSYNAGHWPYQRPDMPSTARDNSRHLSPLDSDTNTRADYVAMMERVDEGVGEILATLDRLDLRNDTIVIFTNDNGGEWLTRNVPLFHHKQTVWEGGIRVPTLIRWPDRIPAGSVSGQVGITMDLTASILAATGTPVPADLQLDGINLLPVLQGEQREIERALFWRVVGSAPQRAVRAGDWKLVLDGERPMLFDLESWPPERENLVGLHSDVARRLRRLLSVWEADVDATDF